MHIVSFAEEEFHKAFDNLLGTLNITEPFFLVVQGFLVGSYGLTWALNNSNKVLKLAILNSPLTVSSPVPGLFQQLKSVISIQLGFSLLVVLLFFSFIIQPICMLWYILIT